MQDVEHVHATRDGAVDQVFALARAIHAPCDGHLVEIDGELPVGVVENQLDLGDAYRLAGRRAGEDDVLHGRSAQMLRIALAENPQHRIGYVRLAGPVRADDGRDARLHGKRAFIGEGFEALQDKRL